MKILPNSFDIPILLLNFAFSKQVIVMKKILDLGFGRKTLFELYKSTQMSSRLQYGLAQLEDKYQIEHISWEQFTLKGLIQNNLKVLRRCDVVYLTYLYMQPIIILCILRRFGFYKKRKLIAVSHVPLREGRNKVESAFLRLAYGAFDKILFHSPKNMEESISLGLIKCDLCELLYWGDDLDYIDNHVLISEGSFFLSTGREHRDFLTLISAFSKLPDIQLALYTNFSNYDNSYGDLSEKVGKYSNVDVVFVEKSTDTTKFLAQKAGMCKCVVVPVEKDGMYYCIGFTSVVEAMAMAKPIISTRNPYYPIDLEKEGIGLYADDVEGWIKAIDFINSHPNIASEMGKKARKLAEEKFNIVVCSQQIERLFD